VRFYAGELFELLEDLVRRGSAEGRVVLVAGLEEKGSCFGGYCEGFFEVVDICGRHLDLRILDAFMQLVLWNGRVRM
jgi:hypothetical protein